MNTTLTLNWLGQSGFLYQFPGDTTGGPTVCIDPYLSYATGQGKTRPRLTPIPLPASLLSADVVITTHDHADHFDPFSLRPIAEQPATIFTGPTSCREHWQRMELPSERFLRLNQGETLTVAGVEIAATYAEHGSGERRDAIGVILRAGGLTIYQTGDSEFNDELVEQVRDLRPHLLTVPINGRLGNMSADEAAQLTQLVQPQVVVPNHYGMFANNSADPQDFIDACRARGVEARVALMTVGKWTELALEGGA